MCVALRTIATAQHSLRRMFAQGQLLPCLGSCERCRGERGVWLSDTCFVIFRAVPRNGAAGSHAESTHSFREVRRPRHSCGHMRGPLWLQPRGPERGWRAQQQAYCTLKSWGASLRSRSLPRQVSLTPSVCTAELSSMVGWSGAPGVP